MDHPHAIAPEFADSVKLDIRVPPYAVAQPITTQ
jgi:hypothetical protein